MSMFTVPFCSDRCLSKIWCVIKQSSWVWGRFITVLRETQGLQKHLKLNGFCAVKDKTLTHPVNSESPLWDLSLAWGSYGKQQSQEIIFCELIFTCNIIKLYYSWPCFPHHSETLWKIIFLSIFNLVRFQPLGSNTEILTFILIVICTQVYKWLHEIFNRPWQRPQFWSSNKVDSYHKWSLNLLWNIGQQSIAAVCPI